MGFRSRYSSIQKALGYVALLVFLTACMSGVNSLVPAPRIEEQPHLARSNESDSTKDDRKQQGCVYLYLSSRSASIDWGLGFAHHS